MADVDIYDVALTDIFFLQEVLGSFTGTFESLITDMQVFPFCQNNVACLAVLTQHKSNTDNKWYLWFSLSTRQVLEEL